MDGIPSEPIEPVVTGTWPYVVGLMYEERSPVLWWQHYHLFVPRVAADGIPGEVRICADVVAN